MLGEHIRRKVIFNVNWLANAGLAQKGCKLWKYKKKEQVAIVPIVV